MKRSESPEEFDLVILGGGTGSTIAAWTFAGEGKQVAVVERKYIGGSCPNIACLPSKNIIHSAKVASYFRRSKEFGITHDGFAINMAEEHGSRVHIGNGPVPGSENSGSHAGR
jgi:pyruvate/2-oxoglutarate dehydrogenase complex dihydrolipoamide dehydrogenase (E3) component